GTGDRGRVRPGPGGVATLLAVFPSISAAGAAVTEIIRRGHRPRALELMDQLSIDHVRPKAQYKFPPGAGAVAIVELDGDVEGLEAAVLRCAEACARAGGLHVLVAKAEVDQREHGPRPPSSPA